MKLITKLGTVLVLVASQLALAKGTTQGRPSMPDTDGAAEPPAASAPTSTEKADTRGKKARAKSAKKGEAPAPAKPAEENKAAEPSSGGGW